MGVLSSPLKVIPEGVVEQPHVQVAQLVLRFENDEFANRLSFIGGHGLAVVLITTLRGQLPHLGCDLGIGNLKMQMGDSRPNAALSSGMSSNARLESMMMPAMKDSGFDPLCSRPSDDPLLPAILPASDPNKHFSKNALRHDLVLRTTAFHVFKTMN